MEPPAIYVGKVIPNKCFQFLQKVAMVSEDLFVIGIRELIPDCWRSYRESMYANIKLSFRNKTVFGNE